MKKLFSLEFTYLINFLFLKQKKKIGEDMVPEQALQIQEAHEQTKQEREEQKLESQQQQR